MGKKRNNKNKKVKNPSKQKKLKENSDNSENMNIHEEKDSTGSRSSSSSESESYESGLSHTMNHRSRSRSPIDKDYTRENNGCQMAEKRSINDETHSNPFLTPTSINPIPLPFPDNKYLRNDRAPFIVIMEKIGMNPIKAGKILYLTKNVEYEDIISIQKNLKVKIICKNFYTANNILNSKIINTDNEIKTYVPKFCIEAEGLIHDIDLEYSEKEIKENSLSSIPIMNIRRMTRWDFQNKKVIQMDKIIVTFRGQRIPSNIKIYGASFLVNYFIPNPILCKNCLSYGHSKGRCTQKKKCINCAQVHDVYDDCTFAPGCKFCPTQNHKTTDRKCPEYIKQKIIKSYMVRNRLSFKLAKEKYFENNNSNQQFPPLIPNNNNINTELIKEQNRKIFNLEKIIVEKNNILSELKSMFIALSTNHPDFKELEDKITNFMTSNNNIRIN